MFDSSYRVVQLAGGQLQIIAPPLLVAAVPVLLLALLPLVFFIYRMVKTRSLFPAWGILMFSVLIFIVAAALMRGGSVTLDRAADTCTFHAPSYFWHHDNTVALHDVDYATLRTMHASSYIAVVLVNGDDQTFADSTSQDGKGRAIKAINDYLGTHQSRR